MSGQTAASQSRAGAYTGNRNSYARLESATGFNKIAPEDVTSNATREPPLMPYFFRNGAGIVTLPRVENFTR